MKKFNVWAGGFLIAFFVFLAVVPHTGFKTETYFFLMIKFICLAMSFNLIAGYVGYISFGHVAFYGIGGYVAAILASKTALGNYALLCLIMGGLGAALAGFLLGKALLTLRGAYFAIATLALNEALKVIMFNLPEEFSGGSFGIPVPQLRDPTGSYYLMLLLALVSFVLIYILMGSRFGVTLKAIREDEDAAMAVGINAPKYKVIAFTLSTFLMGMAGAIDMQFIGYIYPEDAFNIEVNVEVIAMTMMGGIGTCLGPIIGGVILYIIQDFVWARWPFSHLIVLGAVLALIVLYMRRGLLGYAEDRFPALRGRIR